ncbi:chemotaxis protein CheC [Desulfurispirillum indicum]|uniref:CheC domain protein n=1 Tax=Desulfurispirillum indicum (strain ATCC BAA-1389 / DSM 22839 / S5) TaxID=653733 RepID=E6W6F5_DESIS|nr:chemotaxis protein CheC [Desulfurispirillum indicum]ADU67290.1 CheC domain protein [Desulfurispirillum indicum S5]UCZ56662.1 chemotaxis protein CheC [Desulfurispirillum indicum]
MAHPPRLTPLQHDAIVEIFNIGIGQAAAVMSSMVNEEVILSVPSVYFFSRRELSQYLNKESVRNVCGVVQHFQGIFNADTVLLFPEDKSLELVRLMVGDTMPHEQMSEMEQEAMTEIGNIILNACISAIASLFRGEFTSSLPVFHAGSFSNILQLDVTPSDGQHEDDVVLMLLIDFKLESKSIHGHVAFMLDAPSFDDFIAQVDHFIHNR